MVKDAVPRAGPLRRGYVSPGSRRLHPRPVLTPEQVKRSTERRSQTCVPEKVEKATPHTALKHPSVPTMDSKRRLRGPKPRITYTCFTSLPGSNPGQAREAPARTPEPPFRTPIQSRASPPHAQVPPFRSPIPEEQCSSTSLSCARDPVGPYRTTRHPHSHHRVLMMMSSEYQVTIVQVVSREHSSIRRLLCHHTFCMFTRRRSERW